MAFEPTPIVNVAVPEPVTTSGLTVALMLKPKTVATRLTGEVNPFSEVTVMVDVDVMLPLGGAVMVVELGLAERVKSGPLTSTSR